MNQDSDIKLPLLWAIDNNIEIKIPFCLVILVLDLTGLSKLRLSNDKTEISHETSQ